MFFRLNISMDNAAFEQDPNAELARLLRNVANALDRQQGDIMNDGGAPVFDVNGNSVGAYFVTDEEVRS